MKPIVDSPEFTAWLLGELPSEDAAAMERAVAADPAAQLAAREQQQFFQEIGMLMGGAQTQLDGRQREKIMCAARHRDATNVIPMPVKSASRHWGIIAIATAAVAVVGVWLGWQNPLKGGGASLAFEDVSREIALLPADAGNFPVDTAAGEPVGATAVGGTTAQKQRDELWNRQPDEYLSLVAKRIASEPLPIPSELPLPRERGFVSAAQHPTAALPLRVGTASWSWVKRSIIEQGKLPHAALIRPEEIIQAFALTHKNPSPHGSVSLQAFALPSSAPEGRDILLLSLHNFGKQAEVISWSYQAPVGSRYRLIGFGAGSASSGTVTSLAAGASVQVMLELDRSAASRDFGTLLLRDRGKESTSVVTPASDLVQAKFFRLLFDYMHWLKKKDQSDNFIIEQIDSIQGENLSSEQQTALGVMRKSLKMKIY